MVVTHTPLTLAYFIRDLTGALATFNRLVWYRSRTGQNGLYEQATDLTAGPAVLVAHKSGPHALNGKTLVFTVNGVTQVSVPFTGPDPVTTTAAATAINGATGLVVASADADDQLVLTTVATGSGASIEIDESDAAPYVGFDIGDAAIGIDVDNTLVSGTYQYFYTDQNSDDSFFYKVRLFNSTTLQVSDFSVPIPASQIPVIPYAQTLVAFIKLADIAGRPLAGRVVSLTNTFLPNKVDGFGIFRNAKEMTTDATGYAETRLLRGMQLDVAISGSDFVRRITVPTTGDFIDLLDPALVSEDEFGIQQPDIDFAVRTS